MVPNGWVEGRVADLVDGLESGVSVNGEDRELNVDDKAVLKVSAVSYGVFDPGAAKVIKGAELLRAKTNPKRGQIIISRSNTEELVGASAYVEEDYPNLFLPDKLWQTIPKYGSDMKWLSYVLASSHARYTLSNLATGTSGSMKNITKGELLSLKLLIPPPNEQKKIAKIISTWDKAISTIEQLLVISREQKKALMQQLLTCKRRFPAPGEKWKKMALSEFLIPTSYPVEKPSISYVAVSVRSHGKGTFQRVVEEPEMVAMETLYKLKPKELVVNITFAWEGAIAIVKEHDDGCLVSHRFPTYKIREDKVLVEYLSQVIITRRFTHMLKLISPGGAGRNRVLSKGDFLNLEIAIPPLDEQEKIAALLRSSDEQITGLQRELELLKQEKKALMQQLLTGKIRVSA